MSAHESSVANSVSAGWEQDKLALTDEWRRRLSGGGLDCVDYGFIHQYFSKDYCWQAHRGGYCVAGLAPDRESAMAAADNALAMPLEEFNALVVADLKEKIRVIERDLQRLQPDIILSNGYLIGYEDGQCALRRRIMAVMP